MTRRRWFAVGLVVATAVALVAGGWLGFRLATASEGGCPLALVQGTLVQDDGTLAVETESSPEPVTIVWPFGYAVERRDDELVLTRMFQVVARAGDEVSIGGSEGGAGAFRGCGPITLGLLVPPDPLPEPKSTFIVMATAAVPCLPPPSGCGYTATLASDDGLVAEARFEDSRAYEEVANGVRAALRLQPGLPTALAPGTYDLGFEIAAYSDVVSFDADGNELGPERWTGCAAVVTVPELADDHVVTVRVAFDDQGCTIEPSTFVVPSAN